jgi:uncharacterized protein (TIGR03437 family)
LGATLNSGPGGVKIILPNDSSYTPGVTQHIMVQVSDPQQHRWGFQMSARLKSDPANGQTGDLQPTDSFTQVICDSGSPKPCASSAIVQFIENTSAGTRPGTSGGAAFAFDWTPPATNVGNIVLYAAGNAANGDGTPLGDHCYTTSVELTPADPPAPVIDSMLGVQNQTTEPNTPGQPVSPGSLMAIYGTNFASANTLATTVPLPTTLANVSVTFGGIAAPIVGIAHGLTIGGKTVDQINAIVPWKVTAGMAPVIVTSQVASSPFNVLTASTDPGIFYIATDSGGVNRPLVYNNSDNTFAYPSGIFGSNLPNTRPASIANDVLVIWSTGLGPVTVTPRDGAPATDSKGNFVMLVPSSSSLGRPRCGGRNVFRMWTASRFKLLGSLAAKRGKSRRRLATTCCIYSASLRRSACLCSASVRAGRPARCDIRPGFQLRGYFRYRTLGRGADCSFRCDERGTERTDAVPMPKRPGAGLSG